MEKRGKIEDARSFKKYLKFEEPDEEEIEPEEENVQVQEEQIEDENEDIFCSPENKDAGLGSSL